MRRARIARENYCRCCGAEILRRELGAACCRCDFCRGFAFDFCCDLEKGRVFVLLELRAIQFLVVLRVARAARGQGFAVGSWRLEHTEHEERRPEIERGERREIENSEREVGER